MADPMIAVAVFIIVAAWVAVAATTLGLWVPVILTFIGGAMLGYSQRRRT
jgi:UPF0716 family protein affecting phage T7 exclusion